MNKTNVDKKSVARKNFTRALRKSEGAGFVEYIMIALGAAVIIATIFTYMRAQVAAESSAIQGNMQSVNQAVSNMPPGSATH